MADAAHVILSSANRSLTGRLLIDEEILRENGVTEFEHYRFAPDSSDKLMTDLFID
ncbi:short chain dehydrogenase [compost metagenome]